MTTLNKSGLTWRNWVGNQECRPNRILTPAGEQDFVDAVAAANLRGDTVRAVGSGHSFTPLVVTDGVLLDFSQYTGIVKIDHTSRRVRVRAGTTIEALGAPLWQAGLALSNQGDIDAQTIAGAVSTGTHGSGIRLGSFSSTVTALRLVDGRGDVVEIDQSSGDRLHAAQVAMGMLGVILEVELEVSPAYHLSEQIGYRPLDAVLDEWDSLVSDHRHFSFFWCPEEWSAGLYDLPGAFNARADDAFVKIYDEVPPDATAAVNGRIGRSYEIYPAVFEPNFHEFEYFVPALSGREAFLAVRELMRTSHPEQRYPVEVRWVAEDEAFLSPNYERATMVISVSGKPGTDYSPFLRDMHRILVEFDARPHWGKLHLFDRDELNSAFPRLADFEAARVDADPNGTFLNSHLRNLFGPSEIIAHNDE